MSPEESIVEVERRLREERMDEARRNYLEDLLRRLYESGLADSRSAQP